MGKWRCISSILKRWQLDGGQWSAALADFFIPEEPAPFDRRLPQRRSGRCGEEKNSALLVFEPRFFVRLARSLHSIQTQILKSSTARKILRSYVKERLWRTHIVLI
jgi:hypothetical protein